MNYLPSFNDNSCIVVDNLNNGYIRVYENTPTINSVVNYTDYFIHDNYISRSGSQTFGSYNVNVNCVSHDNFSEDFYYRIDFADILIIFLIFSIFVLYIPLKIWTKLFKKGGL